MLLFCYPVASESLNADRETPPARLVHLTKALADERRLRIIRKLARQDYTLQELADAFTLPKTTMHHHLSILRQAGLVRLRLGDNRYSLRSETLESLAELLHAYMQAP